MPSNVVGEGPPGREADRVPASAACRRSPRPQGWASLGRAWTWLTVAFWLGRAGSNEFVEEGPCCNSGAFRQVTGSIKRPRRNFSLNECVQVIDAKAGVGPSGSLRLRNGKQKVTFGHGLIFCRRMLAWAEVGVAKRVRSKPNAKCAPRWNGGW